MIPTGACMTQKTILVIEDERDIVELIRYNLERESFRVKAAYDGEAGLGSVRKKSDFSGQIFAPSPKNKFFSRHLRSLPTPNPLLLASAPTFSLHYSDRLLERSVNRKNAALQIEW